MNGRHIDACQHEGDCELTFEDFKRELKSKRKYLPAVFEWAGLYYATYNPNAIGRKGRTTLTKLSYMKLSLGNKAKDLWRQRQREISFSPLGPSHPFVTNVDEAKLTEIRFKLEVEGRFDVAESEARSILRTMLDGLQSRDAAATQAFRLRIRRGPKKTSLREIGTHLDVSAMEAQRLVKRAVSALQLDPLCLEFSKEVREAANADEELAAAA